uniref:Uncharacterized protein n=1 Tax=Anguilla anguilla TaxID=7936 RepID=A0A0E9U3G4_ANGAN
MLTRQEKSNLYSSLLHKRYRFVRNRFVSNLKQTGVCTKPV